MNRTHQDNRSSQRNAGLRRLRRINRTLAATAVALTLVFANAAARTFSGHARSAKAARPSVPSRRQPSTPASAVRTARPRRHRRPRSHDAASDHSPTTTHGATTTTTTTAAETATTPALSPPASPPKVAAPAPATAPAPAPVVSGGS